MVMRKGAMSTSRVLRLGAQDDVPAGRSQSEITDALASRGGRVGVPGREVSLDRPLEKLVRT